MTKREYRRFSVRFQRALEKEEIASWRRQAFARNPVSAEKPGFWLLKRASAVSSGPVTPNFDGGAAKRGSGPGAGVRGGGRTVRAGNEESQLLSSSGGKPDPVLQLAGGINRLVVFPANVHISDRRSAEHAGDEPLQVRRFAGREDPDRVEDRIAVLGAAAARGRRLPVCRRRSRRAPRIPARRACAVPTWRPDRRFVRRRLPRGRTRAAGRLRPNGFRTGPARRSLCSWGARQSDTRSARHPCRRGCCGRPDRTRRPAWPSRAARSLRRNSPNPACGRLASDSAGKVSTTRPPSRTVRRPIAALAGRSSPSMTSAGCPRASSTRTVNTSTPDGKAGARKAVRIRRTAPRCRGGLRGRDDLVQLDGLQRRGAVGDAFAAERDAHASPSPRPAGPPRPASKAESRASEWRWARRPAQAWN